MRDTPNDTGPSGEQSHRFTDQEVIRYALGDASPSLREAIEQEAAVNEALADDLELLRLAIHGTLSGPDAASEE